MHGNWLALFIGSAIYSTWRVIDIPQRTREIIGLWAARAGFLMCLGGSVIWIWLVYSGYGFGLRTAFMVLLSAGILYLTGRMSLAKTTAPEMIEGRVIRQTSRQRSQ